MGNIRYRYDTPVGGVRPVAMDYARYYGGGGPKRDKNYNTILTPEQEREYAAWVETLPLNLRSDYDYDLRGAWLNGDLPDENYHMIDKWKKPWHATFSDESVYSGDGAVGGHWYGDRFEPSALNRYVGGFRYGNWGAESFGDGGGIHIKKANRGKFTAAAERAGKSVQAYASQILANKGNYSPTLVKRANFARNAARWNAYGGNLFEDGGKPKYPWHPPMSTYSIKGTQPAGTAMSNPYAVQKSQPVVWSGLMKQLNTSLAASTGAYVPVTESGVPSYFRYINSNSNMTKSGAPMAYKSKLYSDGYYLSDGLDKMQMTDRQKIRYGGTLRYMARNSQDVSDLINKSEYPVEFFTMLLNEGYLDNQARSGEKIDYGKYYRARNGSDTTMLGNFGFDSVDSSEIDRANLTDEEKRYLKLHITKGNPFDGDSYNGVDSMTLGHAAAIFDVKMHDAEQKLSDFFGEEKVKRFYNDNPGVKSDMMRVIYRIPNKINQGVNEAKKKNKDRDFSVEPYTINEFYDYLSNSGGKNSSLEQSEFARSLIEQ